MHLVVAGEDGLDTTRQAAVATLRERFSVRHATMQVEIGTADGGVPCGVVPCDGAAGAMDAVVATDPDDGHHHGHGHAH